MLRAAACLLALSAAVAGSTSAPERAVCAFQQQEQEFDTDGHPVTIQVAADRERSPCGPGRWCQPLRWNVDYLHRGVPMQKNVTVAWVCAADEPPVAAAPQPKLSGGRRRRRRRDRSGGRHRGRGGPAGGGGRAAQGRPGADSETDQRNGVWETIPD
ncbi:hypothetical protein FJT64_022304 [Amphibalanus amphitrite]|uniref:Secreted protein n=1 Tax=Amphibalanus amphitrite TaxID=1232801 RepID=A0A6A4WU62_AMPAM|nr:hypothetical protein FJT64_022304 [Amphibalanus amphitrite]